MLGGGDGTWEDSLDVAATKLEDAVVLLLADLSGWLLLQVRFRSIITLHLKWLAEIYKLNQTTEGGGTGSTRRTEVASAVPAGSAAASSAAVVAEGAVLSESAVDDDEESTRRESDETASSDGDELEDGGEEELEIHGNEGEEFDDEDDDDPTASDSAPTYVRTSKTWVARASMWLRITAQHGNAMCALLPPSRMSLAPIDQRLPTTIKKMTVTPIYFHHERQDTDMASYDVALADPDLALTEDQLSWVKEWFVEQKMRLGRRVDRTTRENNEFKVKKKFLGTCHCETLHLSVFGLATESEEDYVDRGDIPTALSTSLGQSLRLPDKAVVRRYRDMDNMVVVTKRLLPSMPRTDERR